MNKIRYTAWILGFALINTQSLNAGNWATSEEGHEKPEINFYGTIITRQDKKFTVDNITVAGNYKNFAVYEMQKPTEDRILSVNPTKGITLSLNLANIKEINVPRPTEVWKYKEKEGSTPVEYIEIEVISKNTSKPASYLIETKRTITCDNTEKSNNDVQVPMRIPINALKSLEIIKNESRSASKSKSCPQVCTHEFKPEETNKGEVVD